MKTHNCMDCAHLEMGSDFYHGFCTPWPEYCALRPGVSNLTSWPFKNTTCTQFERKDDDESNRPLEH